MGTPGLDQRSGRGPATPAKALRTATWELPKSRGAAVLRHCADLLGPTLTDAQGPFALGTRTRPLLSPPPGLLRLRLRSRALRPSFPPSLPAPPLAARPAQCPLLPRLHCRRCHRRVRQGRVGSPSPGTRGPRGAGLPRRPDGATGPGVHGPGVGGSGGENTQPVRPCLVARIPEAASWGHEPGCCRRARTSPALERTAAAPLAGLPESGRGSRRGRREGPCPAGTSPAGAGPRGRAPPAPSGPAPAVQRGAARLGRSSGAVPAPGGSAPHTCLCPAPGDVAPADWRAGGAGAGELTAAPRHWPGRRTRAVAGRRRYRSRVFAAAACGAERVGPGCGGDRAGRGRAGGGRPGGEAPALRAAVVLPESSECAAAGSRPGACDRGRRPAGARGGGAGGRAPRPGRGEHACSRWGARMFTLGERV